MTLGWAGLGADAHLPLQGANTSSLGRTFWPGPRTQPCPPAPAAGPRQVPEALCCLQTESSRGLSITGLPRTQWSLEVCMVCRAYSGGWGGPGWPGPRGGGRGRDPYWVPAGCFPRDKAKENSRP